MTYPTSRTRQWGGYWRQNRLLTAARHQKHTSKMNLDYVPAIVKRAQHSLTINGEAIITTNAKEVINFAKPRITSKTEWKQLKEAVRLGQALVIRD